MSEKYFYGKVSIAAGTLSELEKLNLIYNQNVLILEISDNGYSKFKIGDGINHYSNLPYATGITLTNEEYDKLKNSFIEKDESGKIPDSMIPDLFVKKDNAIFLNAGNSDNAIIMQQLYSNQK